MDIEQKLKLALELCGGSQKRFAMELGFSPERVSSWLLGKAVPSKRNQSYINILIEKLQARQLRSMGN